MSELTRLPYHGLLTDLDNTLYDFAYAQENACRAVIRCVGVGNFEELISALLFSVHGVESHSAICDYLKSKGVIDENMLSLTLNEYEETKIQSIIPFPGVIEVLHLIHSAGIKIGAVSNASYSHAKFRLERIGISDLINVIITPDMCGYRKPDLGIFITGADAIGLSPKKICVLGDNLINDIAPAQALGMYTIHARYGDRLPPEFAGDTIPDEIIDSFFDMLSVLGLSPDKLIVKSE